MFLGMVILRHSENVRNRVYRCAQDPWLNKTNIETCEFSNMMDPNIAPKKQLNILISNGQSSLWFIYIYIYTSKLQV